AGSLRGSAPAPGWALLRTPRWGLRRQRRAPCLAARAGRFSGERAMAERIGSAEEVDPTSEERSDALRGHSTGGGEATRYVARYGEPQGRVAKLVLIGAVPPLMLKTAANPKGTPIEVFDDLRRQLAANRSQLYFDLASGPFYGFNRANAAPSQAIVFNWWRQGMMGGAKAHYDGIAAFSETDFTDDLRAISVPTLVMHGDDDQIVPIVASAPRAAELLRNATLEVYEKLPHGMATTHAELVNHDLQEWIEA